MSLNMARISFYEILQLEALLICNTDYSPLICAAGAGRLRSQRRRARAHRRTVEGADLPGGAAVRGTHQQ